MHAHVYNTDLKTFVATLDVEPVCGEHFCDHCGDCLACYGGDPCYHSGEDVGATHVWILYLHEMHSWNAAILCAWQAFANKPLA